MKLVIVSLLFSTLWGRLGGGGGLVVVYKGVVGCIKEYALFSVAELWKCGLLHFEEIVLRFSQPIFG